MRGPASKPAAPQANPWWDLAAFAGGLALAWAADWNTRDLVWSLWLSSLVVGYASIVWMLSAPLREFGTNVRGDRDSPSRSKVIAAIVLVVPFLFGLAFFTMHFGGFHFAHSVFLSQFFPLDAGASHGFPGLATFTTVLRRYWIFLPLAFVAERQGFRRQVPQADAGAPPVAGLPMSLSRGDLMAPYRNVVRMHLLIFFFAAAHVLRLESFAVYAVVYAAYFFPWRVLRPTPAKSASA